METYRTLMKESTEQNFDIVFKRGAVLAEVNSPDSGASNGLRFTADSHRQYGVSDCKKRFRGLTPS
jgi:hypothetical protein